MSRSYRNANRSRLCHVELLESRKMLAGDVTAQLEIHDRRDLSIVGDDAANSISVEEIAKDRIRVSGLDGTSINGSDKPITFTVTDDVRINLKGGNDQIEVRNLNLDNYSHSDLSVNLGLGHDDLEVVATDVARRLTVQGGSGNDQIEVTEARTESLTLEGEYGEDRLLADEVTVGETAELNGGEGDDLLRVFDSVVGNDVLMDGDAGADYIMTFSVDIADNLRIDGGSNDDEINVWQTEADDVFVYAGTGDDIVDLYQNDVTDILYASLSTGNDDLYFYGNQMGYHSFNGGAGTDNWYSLEFWITWTNFYNFE